MKYANVKTAYGPRYYRSKTEARWAAFFDRMRIRFRYEPCKVNLGFCRYIPDFYLPDLEMWFEVKAGNFGDEQLRKIKRLAEITRERAFLFGDYRFAERLGNKDGYGYEWREDGKLYGDEVFRWAMCPLCQQPDIALLGRAENLRCRCLAGKVRKFYADDNAKLLRAFNSVAKMFS